MDMEWSRLVELEHPWYQGVTLYTISRDAAHESESYQRYLDGLDLASSLSGETFGEATLVTSVFLDAGYKRTLEKKHWLQTDMGVGTLFSGVFSRQKYISCYSRLFS